MIRQLMKSAVNVSKNTCNQSVMLINDNLPIESMDIEIIKSKQKSILNSLEKL